MESFITTGRHGFTTVDDPDLSVIEVDNGHNWLIKFYVGETLIDVINMEHIVGPKLDENVLKLAVFDMDGHFAGNVRSRLHEAYEILKFDRELAAWEITNNLEQS